MQSTRVLEILRLALRLGITAFGGPAAHVAMLHAEVVKRRKWVSEEQFLDLLGATNLIPGPNSTEMVIHIGYLRAGWMGLVAGGVGFIVPAMLIVMGLAWAYVRYGQLPAAQSLLYGVKPVIVAVIAQALVSLGRAAIRGPATAVVGLGALSLYFLGANEILLLLAGGLAILLARQWSRRRARGSSPRPLPAIWLPLGSWLVPGLAAAAVSLPLMFLVFLKIGAVLYGSGYVLLAFLRADFVVRLGWLSDAQLLDAVAVGQVTPGPVFTAATFIGYVLGGVPGALLATLGIFLPAFVFVAISNPLIPRLRASPWTASLLDGVNAAALGLMAAVLWQLGRGSIIDWLTLVLAVAAAVLLFRFKVNATWLVLAGALIGLATGWL